jgi:hypothetical protein
MCVYKYKKMNERKTKYILFNIVFAEDITHTPNYALNTTHLAASTSPAQHTAHSSKGWTGM